ncbi:hypothetical protein LEP1GSC043_2609 [Leptospira weilii str. Ecochallenge]|uniref:Uncharacterized protein n=1 Tax=Leptospira weilii str. Ecochallenge TaxID=1049986 RepID=N1TYK0_9LEPT|nr:hypothetical protein LEP1GSC043_2609 [Leptospira weilii str. Ecochallenge]
MIKNLSRNPKKSAAIIRKNLKEKNRSNIVHCRSKKKITIRFVSLEKSKISKYDSYNAQ